MPTNAAISTPTTTSAPALEAPLPQEVLHHLYGTMLRARMLGQRLRLDGQIGEAILSGALQNAEQRDLVLSAEENPVLKILRGAELADYVERKKDKPAIPNNVVIAEGDAFAGVAAGLAKAELRHGSDAVVLVFASGTATRGTSFESATQFAAKNRLPVILLADWTRVRQSSRNHDGHALSHWPCPTIAVDGRDPIAVYRVTKEAIGAARRGHGPTLVDCVNFLAPGGRGRDERDPIAGYRGYLQRHNAWSDLWHSELLARYKREIGAPGRTGKARK